VVAALLAWLLTGTLLRRLKVIAQFVHRLALGDYSQRLPMRDRDELDQLASDISQLAGKLENIEHNRRAFMADISHELRTPWPCSRPSWKPYRTAYAPAPGHTGAAAKRSDPAEQAGGRPA
jgi:two-component system sensor histidine kinase BaeS